MDARFAVKIVDRVAHLVDEAERQTRPLELDPYHSQLFELFVTAYRAGLTKEDSDIDLTADGLCRDLSHRWGLADAARPSGGNPAKLSPEHVSKMRLLWSVMRMWMEWTYAWNRWSEFQEGNSDSPLAQERPYPPKG